LPPFLTCGVIMLVLLYMILLLAVVTDLSSHRIPNALSLGGIVVALTLHILQTGVDGAVTAILGMLAGFFLFLPLYLIKGMAAGDVKLMAAIGAFVGPKLALLIAAWTLMVGLLLALLYVTCFTKGGKAMAQRYVTMFKTFFYTRKLVYIRPEQGDAGMVHFPYAVALLFGTATGLWWVKGSLLG
jgi:prepilin peptidase CpaA